MTAIDYIREKYQAMGYPISEGYAKTLTLGKCHMLEDISAKDAESMERLFVETLPEFLLMPSSMSELGVSISHTSKENIEKFYKMKCKQLGIPDMLTEQPIVHFT